MKAIEEIEGMEVLVSADNDHPVKENHLDSDDDYDYGRMQRAIRQNNHSPGSTMTKRHVSK